MRGRRLIEADYRALGNVLLEAAIANDLGFTEVTTAALVVIPRLVHEMDGLEMRGSCIRVPYLPASAAPPSPRRKERTTGRIPATIRPTPTALGCNPSASFRSGLSAMPSRKNG